MSSPLSSTLNAPQLCPVCGFSNSCSLADPRTATQPCWCFAVSIDPARLDALPPELRDKACLCPRCAGIEDTPITPDAP